MTKLWHDCGGGVLSTEMLLLTSLLVAGLASGLTEVRNAVSNEFADVANAVQNLNQSYLYSAPVSPSAATAGSDFIDRRDVTSSSYSCVVFESVD